MFFFKEGSILGDAPHSCSLMALVEVLLRKEIVGAVQTSCSPWAQQPRR